MPSGASVSTRRRNTPIYARSVVAAETGEVRLPRRAAFFGAATRMTVRRTWPPSCWSSRSVARHVRAAGLAGHGHYARRPPRRNWPLLGGEDTPALLFTASHGMEFPRATPIKPHQGALLCQDWPGPKPSKTGGHSRRTSISPAMIDAEPARWADRVFLCLLRGRHAVERRVSLSRHSRSARPSRPRRSSPGCRPGCWRIRRRRARRNRPRGTRWAFSFDWPDAGSQTVVFESTLKRLMDGYPVGAALEYFNERYAELPPA